MTTATQRLIDAVEFFAYSDKNKCWPTPKRWTLKEAKKTLRDLARQAARETHEDVCGDCGVGAGEHADNCLRLIPSGAHGVR